MHHDKGFFAEDAEPGRVRQLGTHELTDEEIVDFATRWDPQFFHVDAERSVSEGMFGGLIASGIHTVGIYQRLEVTSRTEPWHVIAGKGIEQLQFRRPVRPGDVLSGTTTITDRHLDTDRRRGLVTLAGELTNQAGEVVLSLTMEIFLRMRPA